MSSLREEIVSEIAYCDKVIQDDDVEMSGLTEHQKCYRDRKAMLLGLLKLYDKEHPCGKDGENDA